MRYAPYMLFDDSVLLENVLSEENAERIPTELLLRFWPSTTIPVLLARMTWPAPGGIVPESMFFK